ncbi:MAG: AbrB/MazE/SpoVT family DNA-binding domain-containing protein [bacterium]|nr:AbrB/MazE/SpoVT family DNA-binding domain-containing protein [bacterium]
MKKKSKNEHKTLYGVVKMSAKGQIIIPADLRKEMDLGEGDQLYVLKNKNGDIVLLGVDRMEEILNSQHFIAGIVYDE